ncbi:MAG: glycoside hydrolase family 5 protein [Burkholderiaceae bacterium]
MITMRPLGAALAAGLLGLLAACASAPPPAPVPAPHEASPTAAADALADFPPLPARPAPGASPAARRYAADLGRGVNFGNMLDAPDEGAWGLRVDDRYVALVGAGGGGRIASVRLPVRWSNHASADAEARIDPAFMARVDDVVHRLLARGVPVVVDMHHYRQLDGDPLDPGERAVPDDVVDVRFLAMWRQIAEHFRDAPPALAFELYNEPHGRLAPRWNELMSRALGVVRRSDPDRIVVVGPTQWNSARGLVDFVMPPDANLVLTIHHYDPYRFTHQGAPWVVPPMPTGVGCCSPQQLEDIRGPLDTAQRWGERHGYPVWVGEFGAFEAVAQADRVRYTRTMRDEIERRGMTWAYWELAAGFGFIDPATGEVRPNGIEAALFGP